MHVAQRTKLAGLSRKRRAWRRTNALMKRVYGDDFLPLFTHRSGRPTAQVAAKNSADGRPISSWRRGSQLLRNYLNSLGPFSAAQSRGSYWGKTGHLDLWRARQKLTQLYRLPQNFGAMQHGQRAAIPLARCLTALCIL